MYSIVQSSVDTVIPSSAPPLQVDDEAIVTPVPSAAEKPLEVPAQRLGPPPDAINPKVIHREERLEYRDAKGNVLNLDQVEELKGKVKFEVGTSYLYTANVSLTLT